MADRDVRAAAAVNARGHDDGRDRGVTCKQGCATHTHHESHQEPLGTIDPTALISARGLGLVRNGRDLLDDIDLDIRKREIVTLIGPNGAGKTSLVRVLLGLETPDRGEVRRQANLRIGYVPQRFDVDAVIPMT